MTLGSTISVALSALQRHMMRSLLTMLGIVIGVAAVVTMQSMGQGAAAYVGETISGLGTNMLIVQPGVPRNFGPPAFGVPVFTTADVDAIRLESPDVSKIAPTNQRTLRLVVGSNNRNVNVTGVTPDYFDIRGWGVAEGRSFTQEDDRQGAAICIIGKTVEDALFPGTAAVGKEMRVHDVSCRVVGVLEAKGSSAFGQDQDDVAFMPFATFARRILGNDRVGTIMASANSPDQIDDAKAEITAVLLRRRHILTGEEQDFAVQDPREFQAVLQTVMGVLTTLLAGVAAVSLVVGGIGIMNIMLVSVTERTREIGTRLAIGARSNDIMTQFLVESVILSALGGMIGICAGLAGAYGVARLIGIPYVIPISAIPLAFGVSALIGITFGVFPARKASRLNPLAALRFE